MELYSRSSAADGTHPDPNTGLEDSMWRLRLDSGGEDWLYPERPGEQDCNYFIRTGSCGFGEKCRYNHPRDCGVVASAEKLGASEYPERIGQPICEYFLKTGTCRFGSMCKYHHPGQGGGSVLLNYYGYPLRPGEKECSYYVKTGQCKFGSTCKFHHPQSADSSVPSLAPAFYPVVQPPTVPSPHQYPSLANWQVGGPSMSPASYMQGSYGPVLLSPSVVPVQGWSTYPSPVNPVVSPGGQQMVPAGLLYGLTNQSSPSMPAYPRPYPLITSSGGPQSRSHKEYKLPDRPGKPECQHYLKTGFCKFGAMCKYHHPPHHQTPNLNCVLSPLGLPLRPGAQPCPYYAQHGVCKFGPTCKYDHLMGILSYSPSASSLSDMPVAPYPVGFSLATLVPSSSYSELQPELIISSKENTII